MRPALLRVFIICLLMANLSIHAQQMKQDYVEKIISLCAEADIVEIEPKENYVEIDYLCNGKLYEIGLSHNNEILFQESEADIPKSVLKKIQKKLNKDFYAWIVDEYTLIKMPDTSFYKVELLNNGVESNVYFSLGGKSYKASNAISSQAWTLNDLAVSPNYANARYRFLTPDEVYEMPEVLKEISGISLKNDSIIYCVQDELGVVFEYNMQKEELSEMFRFTDQGDFEDITIQNEVLSVLRSDGTVFSFKHENYNGSVSQKMIPFNCLDVEGLYYHSSDQMYYVACKSPLINGAGDKRVIYRYSSKGHARPQICLNIQLDEINRMLKEHYSFLGSADFQFNPSAISIHPTTGETFVLSASNRLLAIYNKGVLREVYPLPAELYYKPEGLTFASNGDLYLSSEGIKKGYVNGTIYLIRDHKK